MKICVLAYNSVLSDARILRECNSLAQAGYSVDIIGFADNRHNSSQTLPNGVRVTLLNPLRIPLLMLAIIILPVLLALGLIASYEWYLHWQLYAGLIFLAALYGGRRWIYSTLRARGLKIPTFAQCVGKLKRKLQKVKFVHLVYGPFRGYLGRRLKWRALRNATAQMNPDIIHCHDLMTLPAGVAVVRDGRPLLVWDAHEIYEEMAQMNLHQRKMNQRLLKEAQNSVGAFITINDSIADFYRENYASLPPAIIIKNATVRTHSLRPDKRLHRAANLPAEQKILLYQGGFAEKRGLHALVAAARFLDPEWTLVMMGWGNIEEDLRRIGDAVLAATRNRKVPAVQFLPGVPQAELVLWTADAAVGVIPYERCGLNHLYCTPNKLWEYPNAGVPILCSPLVEMSKVIDQYNVGWLLPDDASPEAIAAIINRLSEADIERAKAACVGYMEQENWSVYEARLLHLYERLSGRKGNGAEQDKLTPPLGKMRETRDPRRDGASLQ